MSQNDSQPQRNLDASSTLYSLCRLCGFRDRPGILAACPNCGSRYLCPAEVPE